MPKDDAWNWPLLLYIGTVLLRKTEAQFWRMLPRKLNALSIAHIKMNPNGDSNEKDKPVGYIDQVM